MEKKRFTYNVTTVRYGLTNFASSLVTSMASTFFAVFLTDAIGLSAALMGVIISISGLVDTISVPIVGVFIQKANFKTGKFRPWILWGGVACAIFSWLRFTDIGVSVNMQGIYYGALYSICYIAFNFAYSGYTGLLPVLSKSPADRVALSSCRIQFNSLSKFVLGLVAVSLITFFGGGDKNSAAGYSGFAALLGVIVFLGFIQLFFLVKPHDRPDETAVAKGRKSSSNVSILDMLKSILNIPMALFLVAGILKIGTFFSVNAIAAYYYDYVIGDRSMLTVFLSLSTLLMFVGSTLTPFLAKAVKGARNVYILGGIIYGSAMLISYLFGKSALGFTIFMSLGYTGYSMMHASEAAVYSTLVDYTLFKTNKDIKGFLMSVFTLSPKLGSVLQGVFLGVGLTAIGFVANNVTEQAIQGIPALMSLLPAIMMGICVVAMLLFPLTDKKVAQMQEAAEQAVVKEG